MIKVRQEVKIYEDKGEDLGFREVPPLLVESHWNRDVMVVLKRGSEHFTVSARDLRAALDNATNINRHG